MRRYDVIAAVVVWMIGAAGSSAVTPQRRAEVEADWGKQADVKTGVNKARTPRGKSKVTTTSDALGGCDGIKRGRFGCHTDKAERPWWQVDLGRKQPIDRVLVYNDCDNPVRSKRASQLSVRLSDDGS